MPVYSFTVVSLDGKTREKIEVTGSQMPELATVKRPNMSELELSMSMLRTRGFM